MKANVYRHYQQITTLKAETKDLESLRKSRKLSEVQQRNLTCCESHGEMIRSSHGEDM